jgi:hypothetical protein
MVDLVAIGDELKDAGTDIYNTIKDNPLLSAGVATAAVVGTVATVAAISGSKKKPSKSKSKSKKRRASSKKSRKKSYKYARTAGKGKDRSTRRIRMTKNGQPYVIMASGKARFISKKSARLSRKRKGGRY